MTDEHERKTERVHLLMSPKEIAAIDNYGFAHRIRTRGATIRALVSMRLSSYETVDALAAAAKALMEYVETGKIQQDTMDKFAKKLTGTADVLTASSTSLFELRDEIEGTEKQG